MSYCIGLLFNFQQHFLDIQYFKKHVHHHHISLPALVLNKGGKKGMSKVIVHFHSNTLQERERNTMSSPHF